LGSLVRIPGPLRLVHGETATLFDVLLVYTTAIAFGLLTIVFAFTRVEALHPWKAVLLFLLAADVSGGATAVFTEGTDAYYCVRPRLRWGFIFIHFFQPLLMLLLFDGKVAHWVFLYVFTVASASLVNSVPGRTHQQGVAVALFIIGIAILLPIALSSPLLAWFGPVYMLKLILGFSVHRFVKN
jgi:hypothetical protein